LVLSLIISVIVFRFVILEVVPITIVVSLILIEMQWATVTIKCYCQYSLRKVSKMIIKCEKIVKTCKTKYHTTQVFNGASIEIRQGDYVAITGRSGSGKTTLLNIWVFWTNRTAEYTSSTERK